MVVDRPRAGHAETEVAAGPRRLQVEIIQDFDVIGNKPDRAKHDVADPLPLQFMQACIDVGFEPGGPRVAAPALPVELPVAAPEGLGDVPAGRLDLGDVRAALGDGRRDAVRREDEPGRASDGRRGSSPGPGGPGRPGPRRRAGGRTRARPTRSAASVPGSAASTTSATASWYFSQLGSLRYGDITIAAARLRPSRTMSRRAVKI